MKLYYSPGACSLSPHILAKEAGLAITVEPVNLKTHHFKGGDFYKVNPKGAVPTLALDNGQILTEGAVIAQYLADQKPESGLMPKPGTWERYRAQEWLNYVASEIHKSYSPLWRPMPEEYKQQHLEGMAKKFEYLDSHLKTNSFLMGNHFSAPDAYLFTVLSWSPKVGVDLSKWTNLGTYMERVKARPAVQAALKEEGLI